MTLADENWARLAARMESCRFGVVRWVAETGSTNADLLTLAADPTEPEQVLVADYQSAGRGRRDRRWESAPRSALMLSVLVRNPGDGGEGHRFTTAMGLAAREACEAVANVHPRLKWPNDLVFGNAKLAGVLAEAQSSGSELQAIVVGIGINVLSDGISAVNVRATATSLAVESSDPGEIDRVVLAAELLKRFEWWCAADVDTLRDEHLRHSATVGNRVRVQGPDGSAVATIEGEAVDIDRLGRLIVDVDGTHHVLSVGDVAHVRRS